MGKKYDKQTIKEKRRNPAISLARVLAMFLIIQSHSDLLFPPSISFLATGGALGNELFFLIGGYLYSCRDTFCRTTVKRFIRLYIPTYIMTLLLYITRVISLADLQDPKEIIYRVIWPTSFWFVSAIFFDGIILHLLENSTFLNNNKRKVLAIVLFTILNVLVYILFVPQKDTWIVEDAKLLYGMFYYKCIYSFLVFYIGYGIKQFEQTGKRTNINDNLLLIGAVLSFLLFYGFKYALNRGFVPMNLQIISQPITIICVLMIFLWIMNSKTIIAFLNKSGKIEKIVNGLGMLTLEAFLIQFELIRIISNTHISFPSNYIIAIVTILVFSFIFNRFNQFICGSIIKRLGL